MEVSSTMVRSNISKNKSLDGLVPKEVAFLIKQQNLYQNG
jgi:nicotinic acid mononucleotide adenylyltransferase